MKPPVVIFFVGNPSRGDDALGPVLCARLEQWLANADLSEPVELVEDFQLQVEHALDLQGRRLALFVDAALNQDVPVVFGPTQVVDRISHCSHALTPGAVLQAFAAMGAEGAPAACTLSVAAHRCDLGEGLSSEAEKNAQQALALLCDLLRCPEPAYWASRQTDKNV